MWVERWESVDFKSFLWSCRHASDLMILDSSDTLQGNEPYTYVCFNPFARMRVKSGQLFWNQEKKDGTEFWNLLQRMLSRYQTVHDDTLPPFQGGAIGYWGYELAQALIEVPFVCDDIQMPDAALNFYATVAAYDHRTQEVILMMTGLPGTTLEEREEFARQDREIWLELKKIAMGEPSAPERFYFQGSVISNFTRASYCQAVADLQSSIRRGDLFQANLTQQFQAQLPLIMDKFDLYWQLRQINPAPFSAYLSLGNDEWVLSSSPERFIRLQGKQVQTEPIKGTRKRILDDEAADQQLRQSLMVSEKDRSENIMIVDLMRNDIAQVCVPGTVNVRELCGLRTFASVHHLVSIIVGELNSGFDAVDLLRTAFPPGSVTGAPKLKALEQIALLEQKTRGPYCGCLGYLSFSGYLDTAVTIRTYAVKGDQVFFGSGGAVVLGSVPEEEYEESFIKASKLRALLDGTA